MPRKKSSTNVFASYGRRDYSIVRPFVEILRVPDRSVFLDRDSILPGMKWRTEIERSLTNADVVFVFWTHNASKSVWVRREYNFAIRQNKQVIPVLLDDTPLPRTLKKFQYIDFRAQYAAEGTSDKNVRAFSAAASTILRPPPVQIPQWLLRLIEIIPPIRIPKWALWVPYSVGLISMAGLIYFNTGYVDTLEIVVAENEPVKVVGIYPSRRAEKNSHLREVSIEAENVTSKSIIALAYIIAYDSCQGTHSYAGIISYGRAEMLGEEFHRSLYENIEINLPRVGDAVKLHPIYWPRWQNYDTSQIVTKTSIGPKQIVSLPVPLWDYERQEENNCERKLTPLLFLYKVAFSDGTGWKGGISGDASSSEWRGSQWTPYQESDSP